MFQDDGVQVLSVDVSTSTNVVYLTKTLVITTNTPFVTTKMYNLALDSGVWGAGASCGCMCVWALYMIMCFYVYNSQVCKSDTYCEGLIAP